MLVRGLRPHKPSPLGALARGFLAGAAGAGVQSLFVRATASIAPQPSQPPAGQSGNDAQAQAPAEDGQTFSGTIAKTGDKYVLQDTSGKTYDVDHQEALKQYEGKKVRIKGTLDPDGKTIHIK